MARIQVRYVTKRVKPSGRVYWYWQRRGFPLIRLPDDEGERLATATKLNEEADAKKANLPKRSALPDNAVTSVIRLYEQTEGYKDLADGTRTYYDRHLRQILRTFGDLPFNAITRRVVVDYCHGFSTAGEQRKAAAVMSNLFEVAVYHGHATENHARKLRLKTPKRRKDIWTDEEIAAFLAATKSHHAGPRIALYFNILRYTAQRPGDVAAMTWKQYTGQTIKLRQQKTAALIEVPCHRDLRAILDAEERRSIYLFAYPDGTPLKYQRLFEWEREIRREIGLSHLQMRDLRRTAMVRMGEAGAEIHQIAAVSGHTIETTKQILETYLPRTVKMARGAISLWEGESV